MAHIFHFVCLQLQEKRLIALSALMDATILPALVTLSASQNIED